jgi:predicted Zn finger-like uncharacterized protein
MILTCEKCDTSFSFNEDLIQSSGSKVRCSKCRHIFVAYPPTPIEETAAAVPTEENSAIEKSVSDAANLDDLDLDAIEKSLDLDTDLAPEKEPPVAQATNASDMDLDFDEDDSEVSADEIEASLESTDELDFDLDLDFDSASNEVEGGVDLTSEATETMNFELDLGVGDEASESVNDDDLAATEDISFDLDLGLDEEPEGTDALTTDGDTTDDIDFELDLDLDDTEADQSGSGSALQGLDFDPGEKSVVADSGVEFDETQELDLSDMDSLLDLGHEEVEESVSDESTESLDFGLDFGQEANVKTNDVEEEAGVNSSQEDLEFELDLDPIETDDSAIDNAAEIESTEELELADLEEMIESEDDSEQQAGAESEIDELNFELDQNDDILEDNVEATAVEESEVTDDFDLTGLDDLLEIDDGAATSDEPDSAHTIPENNEIEMAAVESNGEDQVALDDMFDLEMEELDPIEDTVEAEDEFSLDLDDQPVSETETESKETIEDQEEDEFDLSDLDDMLEIDDSPKEDVSADEEEEFELDLDFGDTTVEDETGEAGLDFEVEEEEPAENNMAEVAAVAGAAVSADSDSDEFDMGATTSIDDEVIVGEEVALVTEEPDDAIQPVKAKKKRVGGLMKTLLVLVLLIGGGFGAIIGAQYLGIDIPYLDKVKDLNIPFVSDLLGPKQQDGGNLNITIIEKDVDGKFVTNKQLGTLYVVSGVIKNDYNHPRSFIQITGKLYTKGRELKLKKTVYAGNVLADTELSQLNQAAINKKLSNRMGKNRSNLNLKKGAKLPFMIVFNNLPQDPDEYTVEVAGSVKAKN